MRSLLSPRRPLPGGGSSFRWTGGSTKDGRWQWCRVYHRDSFSPHGQSPRTWGPLSRFDTHRPDSDGSAKDNPERSVLYIGEDLATSACEVFGPVEEAAICPSYRVAFLRPTRALTMFDLTEPGSAMAIGALPALADGPFDRALTQEWARAIDEDQPLGVPSDGILYRSGYNGGRSLAVWSAEGKVDVLGQPESDLPLAHPGLLAKLKVDLQLRRIVIRTITKADCVRCRQEAERIKRSAGQTQ